MGGNKQIDQCCQVTDKLNASRLYCRKREKKNSKSSAIINYCVEFCIASGWFETIKFCNFNDLQ